MTDLGEFPLEHEKCLEETCRYYNGDGYRECSLQTCDSCSYYNSMSGNCSIDGEWVNADTTWCDNGDFYNPYERLI